MNELFPIFIKLDSISTLVVGGGYVGLEKATAIFRNSPRARVTLVAPAIREELYVLASQYPTLELVKKSFSEDDLIGKDLVIGATNDVSVNQFIQQCARKRHLLVNIADTPALCDFYLSSVVQKGNLKLGISTNGLSPTLAKRLREVLTDAIPDNIETAMHQLNQVRELLKGDFEQKVEELNRLTKGLLDKPTL